MNTRRARSIRHGIRLARDTWKKPGAYAARATRAAYLRTLGQTRSER